VGLVGAVQADAAAAGPVADRRVRARADRVHERPLPRTRGGIYSGGTLPPGPGFDPSGKPGIGTWSCHGLLMLGPGPSLPDVRTGQEHALGPVGARRFGRSQLHSNSFEPHDDKGAATRSVIGGTGRFAAAQGVVVESAIGTNTTKLPDGSDAPNLRFEFRLHR
jgi:hypothetical protein